MKRIISIIVSTALVVSVILTTTTTASASGNSAGEYRVSTSAGANLNVRSGAGTSFSVRGSAANGIAFTVTQISGSWGFTPSIRCGNGTQSGWVSLDFATRTGPVREQINATRFVNVGTGQNLNMRAGAGTNHAIISTIARGTALHIMYAEGDWAYATFAGKYGWVSREFLSVTAPAAPAVPAVSASSNRAAWLRSLIGTPARDWGNAPGTQCVDLAKWYAEQITPRNNRWVALGNGNAVAQGIAGFHGWNYSTNRNDIRVGDIVSFNAASFNNFDRTYGHVVIVYEVSGNTFRYIDQWAGSGTIRTGTATLGRSDIVGRARPPA